MGTDDESEARYEQEVRNTERRGVWTNDIPGLSNAVVDVNNDSIAVARNAHDEEDLDDVDGASLDNGSEQRAWTASSGASQPTAPAYLHQTQARARRKTTTATKKRIMETDDEREARYEQKVRNTERRGVWTNDIPGLSNALVDVNDEFIAVARNAHDEEDLDDVDGASLDNGSEQRAWTASSGASQPTAPVKLLSLLRTGDVNLDKSASDTMVPKLRPKAPRGPPPEWFQTPAGQNRKLNDEKRKHNDKKRKQSPEEQQNVKHNHNKSKFSDEHLDRWIWTAKGCMTWRQFYDKNGCD